MHARQTTASTLASARRFYDRYADDDAISTTYGYFTHHPFARLNAKRLHLISELVADRSSELGRALRIADLASGGGLITCALAAQGHTVVGIDLSQEEILMAERFAAEQSLPCQFIQADLVLDDEWEIRAANLLGGTPDVVTLAYALHHFPPDRVAAFVARLGAWLTVGAWSIVNEENPHSPAWRAKHRLRARIQHDTDIEHHRLPETWKALFDANGFRVAPNLVAADMLPVVARVAPARAWSVLFTAIRV